MSVWEYILQKFAEEDGLSHNDAAERPIYGIGMLGKPMLLIQDPDIT